MSKSADEIWLEPAPGQSAWGPDWSETNCWGESAQKYIRADLYEAQISGHLLSAKQSTHNLIAASAYRDALELIINWADLVLKNREEFESHHSADMLTGPAFDAARELLNSAINKGPLASS